MSAANLAISIRTALLAETGVTSLLTAYKGSYPVFTRRPAPTDAPYPMVLVSPDITITEQDGINDYRPVQTRDVIVYGHNSTATKYRTVETLAYTIRTLFHSQRLALDVQGWHVVTIDATGPVPAPTDDDQTIGRRVSLAIQLAKPA